MSNDQLPQSVIVVILVALGLVAKEVLKKIIDRWFKKAEIEYVTTQQCEKNRNEIMIQADIKINSSKNETHRLLESLNKNMEQQGIQLEKLNENLLIVCLNNSSLTDEQKQQSVIDLSSRSKKKQ